RSTLTWGTLQAAEHETSSMRWTFQSNDAGKAYGVRFDLLAYLESHATEGSDLEGAALIFGELVGNVVRHAPGPIAVELYWEDGTAVLRVVDRGPGFEWSGRSELPDSTSECGRGLYIASQVALALQVHRLSGNGTEALAWLPVSLGIGGPVG
ncbi:MAG TPA: ATP-binding protein, partial [Candidatus Baltobacteraceae bacterium]|nr:ATP-binding protein [Candidatus Baltobacteraceae bacterium]